MRIAVMQEKRKYIFRSFESLLLMFCIYENRMIVLGIKTGKPLETLVVFGLQSFRPHMLVGEDGFVYISARGQK